MPQVTLPWSLWLGLLQPFAWAFTRPGHRRFVEWITALALNVEEHTITQSVAAIARQADWRAMERFAEDGRWDAAAVTRNLARLIEQAPGCLWYGYHVSAGDDAKVHRSDEPVWGTCTFHEDTARCPDRAATVRAPNWVVLGALLHHPDQPAWFLPVSGRLYFRKSQLPARSGATGTKEAFRTKCELAVELIREQARIIGGRHLAVCDGGYALKSVARPLVAPEEDRPRIEFRTRLRHDARPHTLPPTERRPGQRGRRRSGAASCPRPAKAAAGPGGGMRGTPSSTGGGGRCCGRGSCASGGSRATMCRSRRWSPRSRGTRSGSRSSRRRRS